MQIVTPYTFTWCPNIVTLCRWASLIDVGVKLLPTVDIVDTNAMIYGVFVNPDKILSDEDENFGGWSFMTIGTCRTKWGELWVKIDQMRMDFGIPVRSMAKVLFCRFSLEKICDSKYDTNGSMRIDYMHMRLFSHCFNDYEFLCDDSICDFGGELAPSIF